MLLYLLRNNNNKTPNRKRELLPTTDVKFGGGTRCNDRCYHEVQSNGPTRHSEFGKDSRTCETCIIEIAVPKDFHHEGRHLLSPIWAKRHGFMSCEVLPIVPQPARDQVLLSLFIDI